MAAKTGTAEYGTDQPPRTLDWMIAIQADLAVAVFVEDGASGSKNRRHPMSHVGDPLSDPRKRTSSYVAVLRQSTDR